MKQEGAGPKEGIIIRSPNWLGDAVMCLPAIRRLKEALGEFSLIVATPEKLAGLFRLVQDVDQVIWLQAHGSIFNNARQLRTYASCAGLLFTRSFRTALEFWLAGIRLRIGYAGGGRSWLLTHPLTIPKSLRPPKKRRLLPSVKMVSSKGGINHPKAPIRHQVEFYLNIVGCLGAKTEPALPRWRIDPVLLSETLLELGLPHPETDPYQWVVIHPGAQYGKAKQWPPERFIELARLVHSIRPCRWLVIGTAEELPLSRWLSTKLGQLLTAKPTEPGIIATHEFVWHLGGKTSIEQLAMVLKAASLFIGNDSGPMHLAAALGTPVVGLFGSTSPEWTGPQIWSPILHRVARSTVPCSPCFQRTCEANYQCMSSIDVYKVAELVLAQLKRN